MSDHNSLLDFSYLFEAEKFGIRHRIKLSVAKKGKPRPSSVRRKISKSMAGKSNFAGKEHTSKGKQNISDGRGDYDPIKGKKWYVTKSSGKTYRKNRNPSEVIYQHGRVVRKGKGLPESFLSFTDYIIEDYDNGLTLDPVFGSHSEDDLTLETVFGSHSSLNEEFNFKPAKNEINALHDANKVKDEGGVVKSYTEDSQPINSALHSKHRGESTEEDSDSLDKAKKISQVLSKHKISEDTTLYTGLRRNPADLFEKNGSKENPVRVTLPAFTSTSNSITEACGFAKEGTHADDEGHKIRTPNVSKEGHPKTKHVLLLETPKGTEGGSVQHFSEHSNEHEILLNRGLHVEIHPEPTTFIHPRIHGNFSSNEHHTVWHGKIVGTNKTNL